jgi:hypothetical protein
VRPSRLAGALKKKWWPSSSPLCIDPSVVGVDCGGQWGEREGGRESRRSGILLILESLLALFKKLSIFLQGW